LYAYHRILLENDEGGNIATDAEKRFENFKKTESYLANKLGAFALHNSHLLLPPFSQRYFSLHGVNGIIGSEDLIIENEDWERVAVADGLSLWKDKDKPKDFFLARESVVIPDDAYRMKYILENPDFDIENQVVLKEGVGKKYANSSATSTSHAAILKETDGYRLIDADIITQGILTVPVTYSKHWTAQFIKDDNTATTLKTLQANHLFLGVELVPGQGRIELLYDDKPKLFNAIIAWGGVVVGVMGMAVLKLLVIPRSSENV